MKPPSKEFHYSGPLFPKVMFLLCDGTTPTHEERLRGRACVNEDGVALQKRYLDPLGVKRGDVGVMWCDVNHVDLALEAIAKHKPDAVVSLGDTKFTGDMRANLPRFVRANEVWKNSYRDEVERKMKSLRAKLDAKSGAVRPSLCPLLKAARPHEAEGHSNAKLVRLYKALQAEQVVYGVVLDPYVVDLQDDWIPAKDIQDTAWGFLKEHGYISDRHESIAPNAVCVESSIEPYPSQDDYMKAMLGLPHRAYRRKLGEETVHSGSWVMGVKLSDDLWADYVAGKLNAFSIEGFGTRTPMETSEMPKVTWVDLEAKA